MTTAVLIVAAGRGVRAGGGLPKQWQPLAGRTVADWTVDAFRNSPLIDRIGLVLHADDMHRGTLYPDALIAQGGATRAASVLAGLRALQGSDCTRVLIHDVARPLVSPRVIGDVLDALKTAKAAAPALAVTDALWCGSGGTVSGTQDRHGLFRAQTPQGFHFADILAAHLAHSGGAADDVEVARAAGIDVVIVAGDEANLKITTPGDFARAEHLMRTTMDIRTGNGFDVHRFGAGSFVTLCGVEVPHSHGLVGHSDADVGMHAVTDAIYGALAEGDIGQHFPPSDPQWKGAASAIFLRHAVSRAADRGFTITNADCTLICEHPKIGPYAVEMRERMASITGMTMDRISVKATTSEQLGFTGRKEGIAAMATVTLVKA